MGSSMSFAQPNQSGLILGKNFFPRSFWTVSVSNIRMAVQTIVKIAAMEGRMPARVATTVPTERTSTTFLAASDVSAMSAIPCSQGFVDTGVRIIGRLCRGKLLLHALHPGTEAIPSRAALWLGRLQPRLPRIGSVIRSPALGIQATSRVLTFLPGPCRSLSHRSP